MVNRYKHLVNRDLSWLKFNERVLEEAEDKCNPIMERFSFVSIFQSNLNEFVSVRLGSLYDRMLLKKDEIDEKSGLTTAEQIKLIQKEIKKLTVRKNVVLANVFAILAEHGIFYKQINDISNYDERFLERYFARNILPLLSPHIIDKQHPFPFLQSNTVYIAVLLKTKNDSVKLGIIPAKGYFEKLLVLPSKNVKFALAEDLIVHFTPKVFPKHKVMAKAIFSITRNADIDADEAFFDYDMSYRDIMEIMCKKRKKLEAIKLDLIDCTSQELVKTLNKHLKIDNSQVYYNETPVVMSFAGDLRDLLKTEEYNHLFYMPLQPQRSKYVARFERIIPQIMEKDLLLHYPYESMQTFINLLNEAAHTKDVITIRITLYRVAPHSKVIEALIAAAENGIEVVVVVELRARFDEENNIDWSKRMQDAGISIMYGIENYKVHSKLLLITLKHENEIRFITQVGTGNYNEFTSKIYTDLALITANHDIGLNALDIFKNLSMGSLVEQSDILLVSPLTLKPAVLNLIDREIKFAKNGKKASLIFKVNSLNDLDIINKLIEASDAGVEIQMIIRGICCLTTESTGRTRNIKITSIVGRFLEHSRIYIFGCGKRKQIYLSSADFMSRNTVRRVEVAIPVFDEDIKMRLQSIIDLILTDNLKARHQVGGGNYQKLDITLPAIDSQLELYKQAYIDAGKEPPPIDCKL